MAPGIDGLVEVHHHNALLNGREGEGERTNALNPVVRRVTGMS